MSTHNSVNTPMNRLKIHTSRIKSRHTIEIRNLRKHIPNCPCKVRANVRNFLLDAGVVADVCLAVGTSKRVRLKGEVGVAVGLGEPGLRVWYALEVVAVEGVFDGACAGGSGDGDVDC